MPGSSHRIPVIDLYDLTAEELAGLVSSWGFPVYRARQIWHWLYCRLAADPGAMTDLPRPLRERLAVETRLGGLEVALAQCSADERTEKRLFRLHDGEAIEVVLMSYQHGHTLCASTQVGCGMGCVFCATGQMGLRRNLSAAEIVAQVLIVERLLRSRNERLTNVVMMGMGEPLHNYRATVQAVRRLIDPAGFDFGARRITISTVGLPGAMRHLAAEGLKVGLAISLHAATDEARQRLVPAARRWPLSEVMNAAQEFTRLTGRRVTFEWALIHGRNDSPEQARALVRLVEGSLCHVNLIPLNPTPGYDGLPSGLDRVARFRDVLAVHGIPVTVRRRRGIDIQAGCGQLRRQMDQAGRRSATPLPG